MALTNRSRVNHWFREVSLDIVDGQVWSVAQNVAAMTRVTYTRMRYARKHRERDGMADGKKVESRSADEMHRMFANLYDKFTRKQWAELRANMPLEISD